MVLRLIAGARHVAVGANSPIPAPPRSWRSVARPRRRQSSTAAGSRAQYSGPTAARELFDSAAARAASTCSSSRRADRRRRQHQSHRHRRIADPRCVCPALLARHISISSCRASSSSARSIAPRALVETVDFMIRTGHEPAQRLPPRRPGGAGDRPCPFLLRPGARRFRLESVHPGHSLEEVLDNTGFAFDRPECLPATPAPDRETLALLRGRVRDELAETYPRFAASTFPTPAA